MFYGKMSDDGTFQPEPFLETMRLVEEDDNMVKIEEIVKKCKDVKVKDDK